ncbi:MAG: DUF1570 domain-containing protein [Thermoguttaceae bacterium]
MQSQLVWVTAFLSVLTTASLDAVETISFRTNTTPPRVVGTTGQVSVRFRDAFLFLGNDGQYHKIKTDSILQRSGNDDAFTPLTFADMKAALGEEFPASQGFNVLADGQYLIVYNTSLAYAEWCAQLVNKLNVSFTDFWKKKGLTLTEPRFPLVAIVLANNDQFKKYATRYDGIPEDTVNHMAAYYSIMSNRIILYDISGIESERSGDTSRATKAEIARLLDRPEAGFNIGSIVHEAVHQVAYNRGLFVRFSPCPLWFCEGLSLSHEVPSRDAKNGWNITLIPNDHRLRILHEYLAKQPSRPLEEIIMSDSPLREANTASDSYAMAWGLTYYLIRKRPKELAKYMQSIQSLTIEDMATDSPSKRLELFEACFGSDWKKLYKECGDYLKKL